MYHNRSVRIAGVVVASRERRMSLTNVALFVEANHATGASFHLDNDCGC
jgi:hypothetical protein